MIRERSRLASRQPRLAAAQERELDMGQSLSRRDLLKGGVAGAGAIAAGGSSLAAAPTREESGFRYCLNTALLRGYALGIVEQVELASGAGYDGIEPWIADLEKYAASGGSLPDLKRRIADHGLVVESAIGFAPWIVEDAGERAKGLEQARREMELVSRIGGRRIAAPPAGGVQGPAFPLSAVAERYRALLETGAPIGVVPELEVWGFASNLSRVSEAAYAAIETDHPDACLLLDVYHLYKGGSGYEGLRQLSRRAVQVLHMNDYPAIPRGRIEDKDRVLPGEGVAPLSEALGILRANGCTTALSIELFNEGYWKQYDAKTLAAFGIERMRAAVAALH
jgi:2-keto-myo-inositol isomerase